MVELTVKMALTIARNDEDGRTANPIAPRQAGATRAGASPRIRVAHVAPGLAVGGLERMLVDLARHSDRSRFELSFIAIGENGAMGQELAALGHSVTALGKKAELDPSLCLRLRRHLLESGAEVVHTHNNTALVYGAVAARLVGARQIIHTRHGVEPVSRKAAALIRLIARSVNRLVCVSEDNAGLALNEGMPSDRLQTLLNGIDVQAFPYRGPSSGGRLVTVARLSPEKDIGTLIRAVAIARSSRQDLRLDIVGDGPCRDQLETLSASLGLNDAIRFLGERYDVAEVLPSASLFILPSLTEGISLTILEAMSIGLPVVATAVGGNLEVVVDGVTGRLVKPGDPEALAQAICHVLAAPGAARRMGRLGRERVEANFDIRRTVRQYETLYTSVSGRTGWSAA
jgi:glycosyltransferase involved in cell wall biosynthesis